MRRVVCLVFLISWSTLALATAAQADGGASIADAPTIVPGQQEFGSLASHVEPPNYPGNCISWWLLPLRGGDSVQIQWEGQPNDHLRLYPPSTTDFNYEPHGPRLVESFLEEGITKREASYAATQTGNYPLDLITPAEGGRVNAGCGPYNLTAYVTHELVIGLPRIASLHPAGTLDVAIHDPEGDPIEDAAVRVELQIKGRGSWQRLGVGTGSSATVAIRYVVPTRLRHQHVTLRALAQGTGYAAATSAHVKVRTL